MVDQEHALWIAAANHWTGREGHTPRYIIVHGTAGGSSAQNIGALFANPAEQASTNYVIGQDGTIVQCVLEADAPWANGPITGPPGTSGDGVGNGLHDRWWDSGINPNLITISIEHVKPTSDNSDQLTDAQKQASFTLIRDICTRHGIPPRKADASGGITGHYSLDPVNRARCPGPYPWTELWAFLAGGKSSTVSIDISNPSVSTLFTQIDPSHWKCNATGFIVQFGILAFYQSFGGNALCGLTYLGLPLSNETPAPGKPGVMTQDFERAQVAYDEQHTLDNPPGAGTVYLTHRSALSHSSPSIAPAIATLTTVITALQGVQQHLSSSSS